ncbi:MAG TPA: transglycosylase SLT domain-containing protein [Burkholderiaceae bacterium]
MLSRFAGVSLYFTQLRQQPAAMAALIKKGGKIVINTAHGTLLILGTTAITALCMMFFDPKLADGLKALSPFAEPQPKPQPVALVTPPLSDLMDAPAPPPAPAASSASATIKQLAQAQKADALLSDADLAHLGNTQEQQWVTNWLSKRYHVAGDAANMLVSASYMTARETKLDPLLILAVMCIESGLNPFAESAVGAQGLMQVMSKIHRARFEQLGGVKAALNPVANIRVGAMILRDFIERGGSVEAGLKLYVGAAAFENDAGYGAKVMAEYHRLQQVAAGKSVPTTFTAPVMTTALKHADGDAAKEAQPEKAEPASAGIEGKESKTIASL